MKMMVVVLNLFININVLQIQLLPIWIVKKIFGYLDPKSLKKVREVNTYWCYVADDVSKEKTCRKYINKVLRKLKVSLIRVWM